MDVFAEHYAVAHNLPMDYGRLVRTILLATEETQEAFATRMDVTQATVSRWLSGQKPKPHQRIMLNAEADRVGVARVQEDVIDGLESVLEEQDPYSPAIKALYARRELIDKTIQSLESIRDEEFRKKR